MLIAKIGHSEASVLTRLDSGDLDAEHDPDPVKDNPPPAVCMTPAQFGRSAVGAKNTQTYLQKLPRLFADRDSRVPLLTSWEKVCAKGPGYVCACVGSTVSFVCVCASACVWVCPDMSGYIRTCLNKWPW